MDQWRAGISRPIAAPSTWVRGRSSLDSISCCGVRSDGSIIASACASVRSVVSPIAPYRSTRGVSEPTKTIFNYRNIAYYNYLPSFADPLASTTGNFLDQQSRDLFLRNSSFLVNILPGRHFIPFFGYDRSSVSGSGIVTIVETSNQYPVLTGVSDHLNSFRGGFRIEYDRWHVTVEQGGIFFQGVQTNTNVSNPNFGNLNSAFLGQRLFLSTGSQSHRTHTDSIHTQGIITATPLAWLEITGQFRFSQPKTTTSFGEANTGNIFDRATFQFFAGQTSRVFSQAL
jgi:hypothetical protein